MRALIIPELRKRWPTARVIHELPLRYSTNRIDLAAVTETEIISIEIKSSRDVLDRLEAQVRAFALISSPGDCGTCSEMESGADLVETVPTKYGTSTTYTKQSSETQELIERIRKVGDLDHLETWTVCHETGAVEVTEGRYRNSSTPWLARMLDLLHVAELEQVAYRHRISVGKRPTHAFMVSQCLDLMTGREVVAAVCAALRARDAFAEGTDPPIYSGSIPAPLPPRQPAML